jgi:hypothetical protein
MTLPKIQNDSDGEIEISVQKFLIDYFFPGTLSKQDGSELFVRYELKNPDWKATYTIGIAMKAYKEPKVWVLQPEIKPTLSIHMYQDKSLCLYSRTDFRIFEKISLARQIIPWTVEWVHFYELWLVNGRIWKGKEIGHGH